METIGTHRHYARFAKMLALFACAFAAVLAGYGAAGGWTQAFAESEPVYAGGQMGGGETVEVRGALDAALANAVDGQTLVVREDVVLSGPVAFSAAVTIDVAGHTVTLDAGAQAEAGTGQGAALVYAGPGRAAIVDSSGTGALQVRVGSNPEEREATYQGIAVTGAGTLAVRDCRVAVTYAGDVPSNTVLPPEVVLHGVAVKAGSFALEGKAQLHVQASPGENSYGAATVAGAYAHEGAASLSVGSDAQLIVENKARPVEAVSTGEADLVQVTVPEGSALYDELQDTFYRTALYDSKNDKAGEKYGTQLYYSTGLALSNGATIRAYSDPASSAVEGRKSAVTAKYLFASGKQTVTPHRAYGVTGDEHAVATFAQEGFVSAYANRGNAYAVFEPAQASWDLDESRLKATCEASSYLVNQGEFDLRDYIPGLAGFGQALTFPSQNNPGFGSLKPMKALSAKVAIIGREEDAALETLPLETQLADSHMANVVLTFDNIHDADGSLVDDQIVSVPFGWTIEQAGAAMPVASDYYDGMTAYRFLGWRNASAESAYDADELYRSVACDEKNENMRGASSGAVRLHAVYVAVAPGQRFVRFKVDYATFGYAVVGSTTPSYFDCRQGQSEAPTSLVSEAGYTRTFVGWASGSLESSLYTQGERYYDGDLPAATADATYTALFDRQLATVSLMLWYMADTPNGYRYASSAARKVDWTQDAIGLANERVRVGDTYTLDGVNHTFLGWSTRESDVEPMFTESLPIWPISSTWRGDVTRYAIYSNSAKRVDIDFYVDGQLYSQALGVDAGKTLNAAFAESSNPVAPTREGDTFKGWNTSPDATTYLLGNMKKVGEVAAGEAATLELHAIWASQVTYEEAVVSFYDEDRTTLLLQFQMPTGMTVQQYYDEDYKPPAKDGKAFTGWFDASGVQFYPASTAVMGSIDVYARYRTEGASLSRLGAAGAAASAVRAGAAVRAVATGAAGAAGAADAGGRNGTSGPAGGAAGDADDAPSSESAQDGPANNVDGNVVGFVVAQIAALGVIVAFGWWLFNRRREGGESDDAAIVAPEMEAIRF